MKASSLLIEIDSQLQLRLLAMSDAEALYQLVESNRAYLREWLPWVNGTRGVADEQAFIGNARIQYAQNHSVSYAIWWRGRIVGTIGYNTFDWTNRKTEIGYWLAAEYGGCGIMTRSCSALLKHAFIELQLNKVEIRCATMNRRSCAIPQRLHFTHEGTSRQAEWLYDHFIDLELYGLLASEWRGRTHNGLSDQP